MILETAINLSETLKWGEPAYFTQATRSGTTIRLDRPEKHAGAASLFVSCLTSHVKTWRESYAGDLAFIGNCEIRFPLGRQLLAATVRHSIAMAFTYHKRKSAQ